MRLGAARQKGSLAAAIGRTSASVSAADRGQRFREVVLPHLADALAFARYLTGSPHDAEDVVQEACIRALAGIETYAGGSARAWLLAIMERAMMCAHRIVAPGALSVQRSAFSQTTSETVGQLISDGA